jgi:rubrerythrin
MIQIFKAGGPHRKDGISYYFKAVSSLDVENYIDDGWVRDLNELQVTPEKGSKYEADLRAKIKALGGKPGGRSSIETLEKQLEELQNG